MARNELTRLDPFDDFRSMRRVMERIIGLPVGLQDFDVTGQDETLPVDIYEKDNQLIVRAALPGVDPDEIEVTVRDNVLQIRAETRQEQDVQEGNYIRHEYRYGRISRSIRLPQDVDLSRSEAAFEHGMLRLSFPKTQAQQPQTMKIDVKGAQAGAGRRIEMGQPQPEGKAQAEGAGGKAQPQGQQQGQAGQEQQQQQQGRGRSTTKA